MVRLKAPLGAGSQFVSLSLPGLSFWKNSSSEPSALVLNGIQLLTAKRLRLLPTWKPSASYSVIDQKALTGGVLPLSKRTTYLLEPSSGLPSPSAKFSG